MKRLVFLILLVLPLAGQSQGFWRPVNEDIFAKGTDRTLTSVWLPRPYFNVTALKINFAEETTVQPFSSFGVGASLGLFKEVNGAPYQVFAANLAVLFGTDITEPSPLELSIAATVTGWQYISAGIGWDFMNKNLFALTSFSFNFNK